MSGKSNRLVYLAVGVSLLSLILSVVCAVFLFTRNDSYKDELTARLLDLEEEHDILLEEGNTPTVSEKRTDRPALCSLLPDPGPCSSQVKRWYYLDREKDCLEFPWGGCQGNDNNFLSLDQCRSACHVALDKPRPRHLSSQPSPPPQQEQFDNAVCLHPPDSGPCANRITRYYHEDGQCKSFEYGGCAGNENNFFSLGECQRLCVDKVRGARDHRGNPGLDPCMLPLESGPCSDSVPRYRWDSRLGECSRFTWSGCGGNSNNFISKEKCQNRCGM